MGQVLPPLRQLPLQSLIWALPVQMPIKQHKLIKIGKVRKLMERQSFQFITIIPMEPITSTEVLHLIEEALVQARV